MKYQDWLLMIGWEGTWKPSRITNSDLSSAFRSSSLIPKLHPHSLRPNQLCIVQSSPLTPTNEWESYKTEFVCPFAVESCARKTGRLLKIEGFLNTHYYFKEHNKAVVEGMRRHETSPESSQVLADSIRNTKKVVVFPL